MYWYIHTRDAVASSLFANVNWLSIYECQCLMTVNKSMLARVFMEQLVHRRREEGSIYSIGEHPDAI